MIVSTVVLVLAVIVVLLAETGAAWTMMTNSRVIGRRLCHFADSQRSRTVLAATSNNHHDGPHMFEDEDCFDLCDDIDWDRMPTTSNEKVNDSTTASTATTSNKDTTIQPPSRNKQHHDPHKPSFQRMRLEMEWELRNNAEDCDLQEIDTCGDFCIDCVGVGSVPCRFCQGAGKLHLPPTNLYGGPRTQSCPVCNQGGTEVCKSCRGSGRIAPWTSYSTT